MSSGNGVLLGCHHDCFGVHVDFHHSCFIYLPKTLVLPLLIVVNSLGDTGEVGGVDGKVHMTSKSLVVEGVDEVVSKVIVES